MFLLYLIPCSCLKTDQPNELMIDEFDWAAIVRPRSGMYQVRPTTCLCFYGEANVHYRINTYLNIDNIKVCTNMYISELKSKPTVLNKINNHLYW